MRRFTHPEDLIGRDGFDPLHDAAGPGNFQQFHLARFPQAEVDPLVVRGEITSGCACECVLFRSVLGREMQLGSYPVPVTPGSNQVHQ